MCSVTWRATASASRACCGLFTPWLICRSATRGPAQAAAIAFTRDAIAGRRAVRFHPFCASARADILCVHGEANTWPRYAPARHPAEIVHWLARRPTTGETFEAVIAPRQSLAPTTPFHIRLGSGALLAGESWESFAARWQAFLRPSDVIVSWGHFPVDTLAADGVVLPRPRYDARALACAVLKQRTGTVEDCLPRMQLPVPPPCGAGRGGARLAGLCLVVEHLLARSCSLSMSFHAISRFLLRAPLLPVRGLRNPRAALRRHPLGAMAVELASPDLATALRREPGSAAAAAFSRYARRAAFRPTPAGLLAGVAMGKLGSRTRLQTDQVEPVLAPSWERMAALGRALLAEPEILPHVSLRMAPSLMAAGAQAVWLELGGDGLQVRSSEIDSVLAAVIEHAQQWTSWPALGRAVAAATSGEAGDIDELLLVLIDRGVLCHDLTPPLVGQPPAPWFVQRLARLPAEVAAMIDPIRQRLLGILPTDLAGTRALLAGLPGASESATDVTGTLRHRPRGVANAFAAGGCAGSSMCAALVSPAGGTGWSSGGAGLRRRPC